MTIFGAVLMGFVVGAGFAFFVFIKVSSAVDKGCVECPHSGKDGKQCPIIQRLQEFHDNNPNILGTNTVPGTTGI